MVVVGMGTQPCTVQAYREQESGVADDLMPSSRTCVCAMLIIYLYLFNMIINI